MMGGSGQLYIVGVWTNQTKSTLGVFLLFRKPNKHHPSHVVLIFQSRVPGALSHSRHLLTHLQENRAKSGNRKVTSQMNWPYLRSIYANKNTLDNFRVVDSGHAGFPSHFPFLTLHVVAIASTETTSKLTNFRLWKSSDPCHAAVKGLTRDISLHFDPAGVSGYPSEPTEESSWTMA